MMIARIINFYRRRFWSPKKYAKYLGVKFGEGCHIATRTFGSEPYLITMGDNVQITNDVKFFTHGGSWVFRKDTPNFDVFGKITIHNNVYIGNNALIMPGVTIESDVIIGAGAVVTKSVPSDSIMGGNPARIIGSLTDLKKRISKYNLNTKGYDLKQKREYLMSLSEDMFIRK